MVVSLLRVSYATFKLTKTQIIRVIGGVQQRNVSDVNEVVALICHKLFWCANRLSVRYPQLPQLCNYAVSQENCTKLFLSELRQISTKFDIFWQKDGKEAKIMRGALISHLT